MTIHPKQVGLIPMMQDSFSIRKKNYHITIKKRNTTLSLVGMKDSSNILQH